LRAGDLLDVAGVDEQQLEVVLEDRPDGLPVDAGGLHRDLRDAVGGEPVAQREQARDRRGELGEVLFAPSVGGRGANAGGDLRLVDIEPRGALDDRLHLEPPGSVGHRRRRPGASENWRV